MHVLGSQNLIEITTIFSDFFVLKNGANGWLFRDSGSEGGFLQPRFFVRHDQSKTLWLIFWLTTSALIFGALTSNSREPVVE